MYVAVVWQTPQKRHTVHGQTIFRIITLIYGVIMQKVFREIRVIFFKYFVWRKIFAFAKCLHHGVLRFIFFYEMFK